MKRSGRTLKQRLYGLKHLPSHIRRARYFRGHGVHSPYIYDIVRQVFMRSTLMGDDHTLYDALRLQGVAHKRSVQLQNLVIHCNYKAWSIDQIGEDVDFAIITLNIGSDALAEYARRAAERGITICITDPYYSAPRWEVCRELIETHASTSVDNRGYLLLFNNHLPKQRFRL